MSRFAAIWRTYNTGGFQLVHQAAGTVVTQLHAALNEAGAAHLVLHYQPGSIGKQYITVAQVEVAAFLFFFVNMAKWVPYAWLGLLNTGNMATALVLLPLAPLGVWLGVRIARRISQDLFYRLLLMGMLLTGCKLLWDGLHG